MKKTYTGNMVAFLRSSWAKGKTIKNFGGNFWGPNKNRCSIFQPETLAELDRDGIIKLNGREFIIL